MIRVDTLKERRDTMRENLRKARKEKGMTQRQVAKHLGISERYYRFIESGDRDGDFEIWDSLEDLFGVHQRLLRRCQSSEER